MSYIYTFIRKDLSPEQRIIQIGHACYEAGKKFRDEHGISSLVLLSAENEEDLKSIADQIGRRGIDFYMFYEPDFGPMGYSALCTEPISDRRLQNFFRRWKLFKQAD